MTSGVSIIIPTTLSRTTIPAALASVVAAASHLPQAEVLLVVNGPGLGQRIAGLPEVVRTVECTTASPAAARNVGIRQARHDVLLFTDDDCVVPDNWAQALGAGLSEEAAIAAPVDVPVSGPVTAFLNYQRHLDAPPVDGATTRYLITANCGFRRDVIGFHVRFEEKTFTRPGGEDAEFGYALRDHGHTIRWLGDVPVRHRLSDSVDEITERFARYGQASAAMAVEHGRWRESVPGALQWFQSIAANRYLDHRRFGEVSDEQMRLGMVRYEVMLTSAFLVGYLDYLGQRTGHRLIAPNYPALRAEWQAVSAITASRTAGKDWARLPIDLRKWSSRLASAQTDSEMKHITANLSINAPVVSGQPLPDAVARLLYYGQAEFEEQQARERQRLRSIATAVRSGAISNLASLRDLIRETGLPVADGHHELEKMLYN